MKKLMISMLAMASMTAMVSCSNENDPINPDNNKTEIKLAAGILKVETKTMIGDNADVSGLQILKYEDAANDKAIADITWPTTVATTASISSGTFSLAEKQYYDVSKYAYFIGYYPAGTINSNTITFANKNGKDDVLLSNLVNAGNRGNIAEEVDRKLTFNHQTSLIKFTFKKGDGFPEGKKVTGLILKGAGAPEALNISTGAITWTNEASGISAFTAKQYTIGDGSTSIEDADALMVEPGKSFTLEITTDDNVTYTVNNVNITDAGSTVSTQKGKQYNIEITFNGKGVTVDGSVATWGSAITGTGTTE